uniref:Uncharacterized protein n=1 Tax=Cyprinodon variegatus TaxID=28743 RepID=A0A3Q2CYK4_CYPVA
MGDGECPSPLRPLSALSAPDVVTSVPSEDKLSLASRTVEYMLTVPDLLGSPPLGAIRTMNSESTSGKLSATTTLTMTVAERDGCPLSSTITVSLCFTASLSVTWRIVLISPFCKPTSNSALSVAFCSLYESQAFCPESTSTATTLVTR